jgi:beta-lactamase superfamily II metal-dependent hydrolase
MAYVLRSSGGRIMVVDGGMKGDAAYLQKFLVPLGNKVTAWFISHPHLDHVDALTTILSDPGDLTIEHIYASLPDEDSIAQHEPQALKTTQEFKQVLRDSSHDVEELSSGQTMDIDGMQIEVLGVKNPEITPNYVNNSSIVFRVSDAHKFVLFTGDLGVEGGQKLMKSKYVARIASDYVQMAHHGQAGVDINFYFAVRPRYCLWPTPSWLWDNDSGKGKGSGPWLTLSVRDWMEQMNVEKHFVSADGLSRID